MRETGAVLARTLVAAAALLAAAPSAARANALGDFGLGARGSAMAGAMTAVVDDWSSNFYNPAGLAQRFNTEITAGLQYGVTRFDVNGAKLDVEDPFALLLGIKLGLPLGSFMRERLTVATSAFINAQNFTLVRIAMPRPEEPTLALVQDQLNRLWLHVGAGLRLHDALSAGIGVFVQPFDSPNRLGGNTGAEGKFEILGDLALEGRFYLIAGAILNGAGIDERLHGLRVGAVWRQRTQLDFDLPVVLDLGFPVFLAVRGDTLFTPQEVGVGVAYTWHDRFTLALDLAWRDFSRFPSPYAEVSVSNLGILLPGVPNFGSPEFDPDFRDTFVPRAGVEYLMDDSGGRRHAFRGGYAFVPSPAPEQDGATNLADADRHVFSAGWGVTAPGVFGMAFPKPVTFDAYVSFTHLQERTDRKGPGVPADNPGFPRLRTSGNLTGLGAQLTFRF